jgi:hypothetical protein
MGKGSKRIEASSGENNCVGSCEVHHVGIRTQEDRGGAAGTVGEGAGGAEEGGEAVLVASPALLQVQRRTPRQIELANAFCRYLEMARLV